MAKAGADEEFRDRARAKDISFGNREIVVEEESCCAVGSFSEQTSLVVQLLLLGRCGRRLSCKLATRVMFVWLLLLSAPPNIYKYIGSTLQIVFILIFCYFLSVSSSSGALQLSNNFGMLEFHTFLFSSSISRI